MRDEAVDFSEPRFTSPILTVREVADLVGMSLDTAQSWAGQRQDRRQLFTRISQGHRGWPSVPLIGLAEASSLRALKSLLPASEVRIAAQFIKEHAGIRFALANQRLVTDGTNAYLEEHGGESVTRLRDNQGAIVEAFRDHLRPLLFLDDDFPVAYQVPQLHGVEIDPRFNAGRMSFARNHVPLFAVAGLLRAGEPPATVAQEYGLSSAEVRSVEEHLEWLATAA